MGQRRLLFIVGDHLSGKTKLIKEFLKKRFYNDWDKHYVDVGLYMQNKIDDGYLDIYRIYPEEFSEDAKVFFRDLISEKYNDNSFMVFDHMEFLLSEKFTGWISILDKITLSKNAAVVIIPSEYKDSLPLRAYRHIEIKNRVVEK